MSNQKTAFANVKCENPFEAGTLGSKLYRIPAIMTLNDGSVMAAADMRYNHGSDSPNNLDTLVAVSKDGYTDWQHTVVNYFDDYADDATDKASASFIDSVIAQSKKTGRIFMVTDAYPSRAWVLDSKKGSGCVTVNGKKYFALSRDGSDNYCCYIGDFDDNGYAPVMNITDNRKTEYSVDTEYRLYCNSQPVMTKQVGSDKEVQQSVFYESSSLKLLRTTFLWLRYSDDNGKTWSAPVMLNAQIKDEKEGFLGIAPGRMVVTNYKGKERIIFLVYTHGRVGNESVLSVYSDDNGVTWHRGERVRHSAAVGKTSECQIIELDNGVLRMYCRNAGKFVASCDSTDGGVSWTQARAIEELPSNGNCMLSFINTDKTVGGKKVIMGSYASNQFKRADGVVRTGVIEKDNSVTWLDTYHVNQGFFAYSCLTQLSDGNIGFLYEDEPAHISYKVLTVDDNGKISDVNGNNITFNPESAGIKSTFRNIITKLQKLFRVF